MGTSSSNGLMSNWPDTSGTMGMNAITGALPEPVMKAVNRMKRENTSDSPRGLRSKDLARSISWVMAPILVRPAEKNSAASIRVKTLPNIMPVPVSQASKLANALLRER
ncbi:hypothetical protein D3C78_1531650 [compost metagenome]